MGRRPPHARPLHLGGVAGADAGADPDRLEHAQAFLDAGQRFHQVLLDVVRQRLEWRHVEHAGFVGQPARGKAFLEQCVNGRQKCGEGLAGTRGCGQQRVPAGLDRRPGTGLHGRWRAKTRAEPAGDGGVEVGERHAPDYTLQKR